MPEFFETLMGRKFYEGTMPRIAKALEEIAKGMAAVSTPTEPLTDREVVAAVTMLGKKSGRFFEEPAPAIASANAGRRMRGLPVAVSLTLLDDIVDVLQHIANDKRSAHVEESVMASELIERIEKETK